MIASCLRRFSARPLAALAGLLALALPAHAQHVYWAAKVVAVSSQKGEGKEAFAPDKILGIPNSLPLGQINDEAWLPKKEGANEFIEVKFLRSVVAQQITVVENFNPGAITKIELVDTQGKRHLVYTNENPGPLPEQYRTLEVRFPPGKFRTIGAVVSLNTAKVDGVNQLDAIDRAMPESAAWTATQRVLARQFRFEAMDT